MEDEKMYSNTLYPEDVKPNRRVMSFVDEFKSMDVDPFYNRPEDGDDVPLPFHGTQVDDKKSRPNVYRPFSFENDDKLSPADSDIFSK